MEAISPTIWFPVVTLVVGVFLKAIFDAWTENRKVAFDRESRLEKRKEIILLQRIDLQRKVLCDLQLALSDLMRTTNQMQKHAIQQHHETGLWWKTEPPEDLAERSRNNFRSVTLMKVRVSDEEVRELTSQLSLSCASIKYTDTNEEAVKTFDSSTVLYSEINEKIGRALRSLEHDEQALLT